MGLADWDIILGGGLTLSDKYAVSGSKSLTQGFNGGMTHIVHKNTYGDAPKNVQVDTWFLYDTNDAYYNYFIGAIARKQADVDTYFYWYLKIHLDQYGGLYEARYEYGYYENGTQNSLASEDITSMLIDLFGDTWTFGKWRFTRMILYESGDKLFVLLEMTPEIDTPDPTNPPEDQLQKIIDVAVDIPSAVANGGAVGLIVGGVRTYGDTSIGAPFYDYTQIYY